MKQKLLLALLALFTLGGSNLFAQTDVTSTYLTNADFEGEYTQLYTINTDRYIYQPNGWTVDYKNVSTWNMTVVGSTDAMASNFTGTYAVTEDNHKYMVRFRDNQTSEYVDLSQTITVKESGTYTFSADLIRENGSKINVELYAGEQKVSNANPGTWENRNFSIDLEADTEIKVGIKFSNLGADGVKAGADNVKIMFTPFIRPTGIALNPTTLTLTRTGKSTLEVTYTPSDANKDKEITWTTSDKSVATVDDGVVTAIAAGTATITATTANNVTTTCTVTVNEAPLANGGDYYLYNEGAGKYVVGANNWGTRASMETSGIKMTATLSDGKYTLSTAPTYTGNYLGVDGYVDQGSTQWYLIPTSGDGYIMQCSSNDKYLVWDGASATTTSMSADIPTDSKGYWIFKSAADRLTVLETATKASPKEATYLIDNPDFSRNANLGLWTYTSSNSSEFKVGGGDHINNNLQQWNGYCTVYQDVTNLPNGLYKMTVQGFYRPGGSTTTSTDQNVTIYAGDEEKLLMLHTNGAPASEDATNGFTADTGSGSWVPNTQTDASKAFTAGYYINEVDNILTTDGTIRIGARNTTTLAYQWMVLDNFRLYYYGPTISSTATTLPEGSLTAGTWYYFDVAADGDYDLTVTTLSDVVYTTDPKVLVEDAGDVTTNFANTSELALTAGRYYIKSASAQSFAVVPHAYTYELGYPTLSVSDGGYTQSRSFTVTFPDAATNDPEATVALVANSTATVNERPVNLTAVEGGFNLDLGELTSGTDYVIAIPADVYGYATGDTYNEAISLTIHTPAVFDGFYFLRTSAGKYVARGGDYNSRAVVDEFGLPLSVATDASGITQFTYVDNGGKLFLNPQGNAYTDASTDPNWIFEATEGGYYIVHADGTYANNKLNVWPGDNKSLFVTGTEGTVFVIEPVSEHNTYMEALKDAQAAAAAAALGNEEITTKAALATWLDANYAATPVTVDEVSFTEKWHGAASAEWGAGKDMYTATVNDLPEGLYKLTVNAYYRLNGSATAAEGARANVYLYGNDAKTQLYSLKDFPASEAWPGRCQNDADGYYPDDFESGTAATTADNYLTELYVYISDGTLNYGIHQPSRFSNGQWFGFQNFTLTRYDKKVTIDEADYIDGAYTPVDEYASVTFKRTLVEGWNGLVLPFDLTVEDAKTKFNATAVKDFESISYDAEKGATLNFTDATVIKAGKPFLIKAAAAGTEYTFDGVLLKSDALQTIPQESGNAKYTMTGTYQKVDLTNVNFVLIQGSKYYQHNTNKTSSAKAFRAYFVNESTGDAATKGINFNFDGEATGITLIEDAQNSMNGNTYNLQGQKVNHAQKGVYIVNGKKIVVK